MTVKEAIKFLTSLADETFGFTFCLFQISNSFDLKVSLKGMTEVDVKMKFKRNTGIDDLCMYKYKITGLVHFRSTENYLINRDALQQRFIFFKEQQSQDYVSLAQHKWKQDPGVY